MEELLSDFSRVNVCVWNSYEDKDTELCDYQMFSVIPDNLIQLLHICKNCGKYVEVCFHFDEED